MAGAQQRATDEARESERSGPVLIREVREGDETRLRALAELDGARPLSGPALVAMVRTEAWAALSLRDGRAIADPFRPSAATVALLRVRATQLTGTGGAGALAPWRLVLRLRPTRVTAPAGAIASTAAASRTHDAAAGAPGTAASRSLT